MPPLTPWADLAAAHPGPGYLLGIDADHGPVRWDPAAGDGYLQVIGGHGAGATYLARAVALQAHAQGHRVVILDGRDGADWADLAASGAQVHPAWGGWAVWGDEDAAAARRTAVLQAARDLRDTVREAEWDPPPAGRTLLVVDDLNNVSGNVACGARADGDSLVWALEWIIRAGRLAGVDMVVTSRVPLVRVGWDPDTVAVARPRSGVHKTMRALGLDDEEPPAGRGRWLVATPGGARHRDMTVPDTRVPDGVAPAAGAP